MRMPSPEQIHEITEEIFNKTQKRMVKQGLTRYFYLRKLKELADSDDGKVALGAIKEVIKLWDDYPVERHELNVTGNLAELIRDARERAKNRS